MFPPVPSPDVLALILDRVKLIFLALGTVILPASPFPAVDVVIWELLFKVNS